MRRIRRLLAAKELVALDTRHPRNDRPGRVIVRRLRLARKPRRHIERVATVDVFTQPKDLRRVAFGHRKMRRRKQLTLRRQLFQLGSQRTQLQHRSPLGVRHQPARGGNEVGNGQRAATGDVAAAEFEGEMG